MWRFGLASRMPSRFIARSNAGPVRRRSPTGSARARAGIEASDSAPPPYIGSMARRVLLVVAIAGVGCMGSPEDAWPDGTAEPASSAVVDATSLERKMLFGYQ